MGDWINSPEAELEFGIEQEGQVRDQPILLYFEGKFMRIVGTSFEAALKRMRAFSKDKLKK